MPRPSYRGFRGAYLRTLRERAGWTQEQLAVRVRAFPTHIGKWERGDVVPAGPNVARLAAIFGVRPQDFSDAPVEELTLVELRVRAGLTRPGASKASGISQRRLMQYEHSTCRPAADDARVLGELYGVEPRTVLAAYDRDRELAYPGLPPEDQSC